MSDISKGILFSAPMVRAILEGRKLQTRRAIKPQPTGGYDRPVLMPLSTELCFINDETRDSWPNGAKTYWVRSPFPPSTILYVKETWGSMQADHPKCKDGMRPKQGDKIIYRADPASDYQWGSGKPSQGNFVWRPSIFMPRWASRIWLQVESVKVEKLGAISNEDAIKEGIEPDPNVTERSQFSVLWETIHGANSWAVDKEKWV